MPGVPLPLRLNARGGVNIVEDDTFGLVVAALSPRRDNNPWSEFFGVGGPDETYSIDNPEGRARMRSHIETVFDRMRAFGRADLKSIQITSQAGTGRSVYRISYTDLVTQAQRDFEIGGDL